MSPINSMRYSVQIVRSFHFYLSNNRKMNVEKNSSFQIRPIENVHFGLVLGLRRIQLSHVNLIFLPLVLHNTVDSFEKNRIK